ncbi:hypothetical protein HKCCE4037_07630 [Rhodobacterales bacterium HKCCE4037]|nr:hypothetical protein [Rhodobacterales bacterium HKCCE4037]
MASEDAKKIPRDIWMLWLQGFEQAHPLVQICVQSWRQRNPGWRVHLLTKDTLVDYLDEEFCEELLASGLPLVKIANIVRLALISRFGGVWADADVYCARPLDGWIDDATSSGFFAFRFMEADAWFRDPSVPTLKRVSMRTTDRVIASWFLAGHPGNLIASEFAFRHFELLKLAIASQKQSGRFLRRPILRLMRRNSYLSSMMGTHRFVTTFGWYPYFLFHYHFAHLIRNDRDFGRAWSLGKPMSARAALTFSKFLGQPCDDAFQAAIRGEGSSPVYKFHWDKTEPLQPNTMTRFDWLVTGSEFLAEPE